MARGQHLPNCPRLFQGGVCGCANYITKAREWVTEYPAEAVKVLLETGALERCGCVTPTGTIMRGHFRPCESDGHEPVYRLVTEENCTDG